MSKRSLWCVVVLVAGSGCAAGYQNPPPRYVEDFAGAPVAYQVNAAIRPQAVSIHLSPGICRRFVVTPPAPPRFMAQYRCPYATAGVPVALWLDGQAPTAGVTDPNGDAQFIVPDDVAVNIPSEMVARILIGGVDVGQVALAPLVLAALDRSRYAAGPSAPMPDYSPARPAPPPEPTPPPIARTRRLSDDEVLFFTTAGCLIKAGLAQKCEEKFGVAGCSAARQWLGTGRVDPREVVKDAVIAAAVKDHEGIQFLLQGIEFFACYEESEPKLRALTVPVGN